MIQASGGNNRMCQLEVLKNQDEEGNWYAVFAENRPLNTLYRMVGEPVIPFSEEDFNRQFHIYMRELQKLLDEKGCKGKYEIFHYKDSGKLNFSKEIIKQLKRIRNETEEVNWIKTEKITNSAIQPQLKTKTQTSVRNESQNQLVRKLEDEAEANCKIETDSTVDMENVLHIRKAIEEVETTLEENLVDDKKNM